MPLLLLLLPLLLLLLVLLLPLLVNENKEERRGKGRRPLDLDHPALGISSGGIEEEGKEAEGGFGRMFTQHDVFCIEKERRERERERGREKARVNRWA